MISIEELYKPEDLGTISHDSMLFLGDLHFKLNFLRRLTDFPWIINRGFSTPEEQIEIYKKLNQPPKMDSCHLLGAAADVENTKGRLKRWILDNLHYVELVNLYMEDFESTGGMDSGWVHFQTLPPLSGRRFFVP